MYNISLYDSYPFNTVFNISLKVVFPIPGTLIGIITDLFLIFKKIINIIREGGFLQFSFPFFGFFRFFNGDILFGNSFFSVSVPLIFFNFIQKISIFEHFRGKFDVFISTIQNQRNKSYKFLMNQILTITIIFSEIKSNLYLK